MKNIILRIMLVVLGLALFFFLLVQSTKLDFQIHSDYVSDLRQLGEIDARINQTILQLRTGTLKNYDSIVYYLKQHENTVANLAKIPQPLRVEYAKTVEMLLKKYQKIFTEKSQLIENFKTENALVRNSLAYLPIAIGNAVNESDTFRDGKLGNQLSQLLRDILIYNLSVSDELLAEISQEIQRIYQRVEKLGSEHSNLNIALVHSQII